MRFLFNIEDKVISCSLTSRSLDSNSYYNLSCRRALVYLTFAKVSYVDACNTDQFWKRNEQKIEGSHVLERQVFPKTKLS